MQYLFAAMANPYTAISVTALLCCLSAGLASCVVGDEASTDGDILSAATNRPLRNGCGPDESVASCANRKGTPPRFACLFQVRAPNALFRMGALYLGVNNLYPPDGWRFEAEAFMLPDAELPYAFDPNADNPWALNGPRSAIRILSRAQVDEVMAMPLGQACPALGYRSPFGLWGTWLPTEAGCASEGGQWNGAYCVAGA